MRTFTVVPSFEGESAFFELPDIGFQGDNLSFAILFNLTELTEHWPNILPSMIITDPKGNTFIAPSTSWNPSTHIFTWNISSTETTYEGYVLCQLKCTAADDPSTIVCMSRICQTRVYASLAAAEDPPEAFQTWIDTLTQLGAQVQADATSVLESVVTTETNARAAQSAADDAELAKNAAVAARNSVEQTAQIAVNAQEAANQALQRARQAASNAEAAMAAANEAQAHAEQALEDGDAAVNEAKSQASSAADSATQAATSMTNANTARLAAEAARDSAIAAKGAAETAQQRAETAEVGAAAARTAAVTARTAAETAQTAAETAKASVDSSKAAIKTMHDEMADYREGIEDYAELSRKWAEGKSSSGDAVPPDDETYHNNSKYWANIAATEASTVQGYGLYVDEEGNGRIRSTTDPGVDVSELATKADAIISSASGAIASFPDGAESTAKKLVVGIEPVQDLHGYGSPWPAGGGKNKLSLASLTLGGTEVRTKRIEIDAIPAGTYVFTATNTGTEKTIGKYGLQFFDAVTDGSNVGQAQNGSTFTLTGEAKSIYFYMDADSYSDGKTVILSDMMICLSSVSDATFAPYSNICPISGWTGAKVTRTGKNLLKTKYSGRTNNGITYTVNDDGTITASGTATGMSYATKNIASLSSKHLLTKILPGVYTFTGGISSDERAYLAGICEDGTSMTTVFDSGSGAVYTFTKPVYVYPQIRVTNGITTNRTFKIQLELGSTATAYEPYQGETYDITFPSKAGTVYGGTLDVTSGVLTVDRASVDLGGLTYWSKDPNRPGVFYTSASAGTRKTRGFCACSEYKWRNDGVPSPGNLSSADNTISLYPSYGSGYIFVVDIAKAELTEKQFLNAMNGVQLVYELATPITYQLTPQEVKTLLGVNNIWADTGDMSVTYRADTKLYIDGKIAAALGG